MRLHYLQHVPFEDLANIEAWARDKGHRISQTRFFANEPLPPMEAFDWLVVLGGPMNIYEEDRYPWLAAEKRFIAQAAERKKIVLGICLGAQLLADVLGGKAFGNAHKEIGWFPVSLTGEGRRSAAARNLPERFHAFHWHGDTFRLPPGCELLAESEACANQAFAYEGRAVGLQFHLESSEASVGRLIAHGADELAAGRYIQTGEEMLSAKERFSQLRKLMRVLLDDMEREFGPGKRPEATRR